MLMLQNDVEKLCAFLLIHLLAWLLVKWIWSFNHGSCFHKKFLLYSGSTGRLAAKIARKDSLALKLSLRPDRDELIARNIIRVVSEKEQQETKETIGAKLSRYVQDTRNNKQVRSSSACYSLLVSTIQSRYPEQAKLSLEYKGVCKKCRIWKKRFF